MKASFTVELTQAETNDLIREIGRNVAGGDVVAGMKDQAVETLTLTLKPSVKMITDALIEKARTQLPAGFKSTSSRLAFDVMPTGIIRGAMVVFS